MNTTTWSVEPLVRDFRGKIRRYSLRCSRNGKLYGRYVFKERAQHRADVLNRAIAALQEQAP